MPRVVRGGLDLRRRQPVAVRTWLDPELSDRILAPRRAQRHRPGRGRACRPHPRGDRCLAGPIRVRRRQLEGALPPRPARAIDDFGTGYSSLAYLKRLPVQTIKIDRSFVLDMLENDSDATIVRSTIDLARNLGLRIVAEGVETQAAWDVLREQGCTLAQGYLISKPVPAEELAELLADRAARKRRKRTPIAARS